MSTAGRTRHQAAALLRRATRCGIAFGMLWAALLLVPPSAAESATGSLEIHVEPVPVDVLEPEQKGKRHWKIAANPPPTVIADEPLRSMLQEEVDKALRESHPWILNPRTAWSLPPHLEKSLQGVGLKFETTAFVDVRTGGKKLPYVIPPTAAAGPAHLFVPFTYTLTTISELRIDVSSFGVPLNPKREEFASREVALPADLVETLRSEGRQAMADRITFHLWGSGKQFARQEEERLLKVARHAFSVARRSDVNVLPTRLVPDQGTQDTVARIIMNTLIPAPRPKSVTLLADPGDAQKWILTVRNVTPITDVKVDARYDLGTLLAAGTTVDDRTKARLAARASEVATEIEKHFKAEFDTQRETVMTADELNAMVERLREDDKVARPLDPRVEDGVLTYPVIIKPTVKTLVASGGIGYTPHEGLTGTAGVSEQNLLGWNEDASLDVKGGAHTQRGDFNLGVPIPLSWLKDDDRLAGRVSLHGLYSRIDDTVLGQPRSATVTEEENSVRLRHSLTFLPFARRGDARAPEASAQAPSRTLGLSDTTALGLDVELGRREVNLRGVTAPAGIPTDGVTAPFTLAFRGHTGIEAGDKTLARVRKVDLRLESTYEHSFTMLGSDLQYDRGEIRAEVEGLFWLFADTPHNDILLRYVHGFGVTSGGTPLFRFFRVGGESNVRGIEEGEFIGRRLHFQQVEAGVSLCPLWQIIASRRGGAAGGAASEGAAASSAPAERECQAGGLDLTRAFVKLFVDHADVADRVDGPRFERAARSIFGTGIALEVHELPIGRQKLSLSIGYAYSPDSQRHRSGTVFTQVVMPFGLR